MILNFLGELPPVFAPDVPSGESLKTWCCHEENISAINSWKLGKKSKVEHIGRTEAVPFKAVTDWTHQHFQQKIICLNNNNNNIFCFIFQVRCQIKLNSVLICFLSVFTTTTTSTTTTTTTTTTQLLMKGFPHPHQPPRLKP